LQIVFPFKSVIPYIIAQSVGAFAASLFLRFSFPSNEFLGATIPSGSNLQSFLFEVILTMILVMVIFNVSSGAKEKGITAAIAIGGVVGLEALFAGPVCGAFYEPDTIYKSGCCFWSHRSTLDLHPRANHWRIAGCFYPSNTI
jgi:aquaporin NIP